jgi:hypothetical protein
VTAGSHDDIGYSHKHHQAERRTPNNTKNFVYHSEKTVHPTFHNDTTLY